jgi:hypothetical protein
MRVGYLFLVREGTKKLERQNFNTSKNVLVFAKINKDKSILIAVPQLSDPGKGLMPLFLRSGKLVLPVFCNESLKNFDVNPFTHIQNS